MRNLISGNTSLIEGYLFALEELLNNNDSRSSVSRSLSKLAEITEADCSLMYAASSGENRILTNRTEYIYSEGIIIKKEKVPVSQEFELSEELADLLKEHHSLHLVVNELDKDSSILHWLQVNGWFSVIIIPVFRPNRKCEFLLLCRNSARFNINDDGLTILTRLGGIFLKTLENSADREYKNKLALVARKNRLGIQITDREMNITYVNDSLKKMTGYSRQELIGKDLLKVLSGPLTQQKSHDLLISSHRGSYPVDIDLILYRKDRSWFWANIKQQPAEDYASGSHLYFSFIQDISEKKIAEEYARNSRRRLSALIQNLKEGILLEDQNQRIAFVNQSFCDLLEIRDAADDLSGKESFAVLSEINNKFIEPEKFIEFYRETESAGKIISGKEWKLVSGQIYEIEYTPVLRNEEVTGHLWKFTDITFRKNQEKILRQQEEKYRNIIDNIKMGLVETDTANTVTFVNNHFSAICGYTQAEITGKKIYDLNLGQHFRQFVTGFSNDPDADSSDSAQVMITDQNNKSGWWLISRGPNHNDKGRLKGSVIITVDITKQKELEQELDLARQKAEDSSKAKETFLATVSHEIRTPLNIITGMIREVSRETLSDKQKLFIHNAEISGRHLLSLLNNVLDITKIESGQLDLDLRPLNIREVIKETVSVMEMAAAEKMLVMSLKFSEEIEKEYTGDSRRIRQILFNVLDNAVKFTEKGSITIDCTIDRQSDLSQVLKISVTDTGAGIDEKTLGNIFDLFTSGTNSIRDKNNGVGLGLAVSRQLAMLMQGDILISAKPGHGTTVDIMLELRRLEQAAAPVSAESFPAEILRNKRILLAEDNFLNRLVAVNSLSFYGMEITEAVNGKEAVEKLKESSYDLVLMDLQMPEMGGLEATRIIRQELGLDVPVIALTANAFRSELDKCISAGMNDFIIKPFEESMLVNILVKNISGRADSAGEKTEVKAVPSELPYDLSLIRASSRGKEEFVLQMIQVFCEQIPEMVRSMKKSWQDGDYETMSRLAHKIKPNLANFGVASLKQVIEALEKYSVEALPDVDLEEYIDKTEKLTGQVVLSLQEAYLK